MGGRRSGDRVAHTGRLDPVGVALGREVQGGDVARLDRRHHVGVRWKLDERVTARITSLTGVLDASGARLGEWFDGDPLAILGQRAELLGLEAPSDPKFSHGGMAQMVRCVDGWVAASLPRREDIESIPAWLGVEAGGDVWGAVGAACSRLTATEVVGRAALLGLAVSAVGERTGDAEAVLARRLGDASPVSPAGLVVANLGSLWASPLAAQLLSRMGARVITVESAERPDGSRATPEFFDAMHAGTEFVRIPFATANGRRELADLLGSVDVVIEGSRPRALEQLGVHAGDLVVKGPRLWVSITGHGRSEPWADRVAFGDDAAAAGGLVGWEQGQPVFVGDAIADPLTGMTAAAEVARLAELGGRWIVDVALARVAAAFAR